MKKMSKKKLLIKISKNLIKDTKNNKDSSLTNYQECKNNFCSKESNKYIEDMKNLSRQLSKKKPTTKKGFIKAYSNYFSKLSKKKSSKDLIKCLEANCEKETKIFKKKFKKI